MTAKHVAITVGAGVLAGWVLGLGGIYVVLLYGPDLNDEF